ncbi:MAG TPA: hypothetical protein VHA56_10200 [Mucilaginibacter sp.]|nr:hypothetical protein [Mucilaginibacter sp.]
MKNMPICKPLPSNGKGDYINQIIKDMMSAYVPLVNVFKAWAKLAKSFTPSFCMKLSNGETDVTCAWTA